MSSGINSEQALRQYRERQRRERAGRRNGELLWLGAASLISAVALLLTGSAMEQRVGLRQPYNLNGVKSPSELMPYLGDLPTVAERQLLADRIVTLVQRKPLNNVGAIGRITVGAADLAGRTGLDAVSQRLAEEARQREAKPSRGWWSRLLHGDEAPVRVALLTPRELRNLKPFLAVRSVAEARSSFLRWSVLFFASFFAVHAVWRWRKFTGDTLILPAILLLCGIGLALMVSLRDPLRDNLLFSDFAAGIGAGCVAMILLSAPNYDLRVRKFRFTFLLLSVLLGLALALFGSGPGASDAKVNLFFFQPVEVMRLLIVLFLAGYFAEHWSMLRDLREKRGWLAGRLHMPRLDYILPIVVGVAVAIGLFFILKDNGPALVIGCVFLVLYAAARKRLWGAAAGFGVIVLAFFFGHLIRYPQTVADRVDMWWSPWRNTAPGGDQLAHSLWSFASGGPWGSGLGLGSPSLVPAGYTDLILSVGAEQLGFAGVLCIFVLYGILVWRSLRIARRAPSPYSFFLVLGLVLITALQLILIAGGILGLIPLSGVVSPFLSYGKTSMVANFAAFAIILAVSSRATPEAGQERAFGAPLRWTTVLLSLAGAAILAKAGYVQLAAGDRIAMRDAEVRFADHSLGLSYNPRIHEALALLPKGDILDRSGLPMASSDWSKIAAHRADYQRLGVTLPASAPPDSRFYPLGPELFYVVGDVRSGLRAGASNTSFQERKSRTRLQGFDDRREIVDLEDRRTGETYRVLRSDYSDLLPLLRHRFEPSDPGVKALLERERSVRMAIDARFQMRVSGILKRHVEASGNKGAAVVMDAGTGDVLAMVSYPWPADWQFQAFRANPDRAMERELQDRARFGLYPPGSSFKIVTAVAALRKDPESARRTYECKPLGDGRVGNYVGASRRPIRDDMQDHVAHGAVDLAKGITVSCNAYFAQLGYHVAGAQQLFETASLFGIAVARPDTPEQLKLSLPQASYGQGQVVVTPFQMARVAATIADGGRIPQGRWVIDESNPRAEEPKEVLAPKLAAVIGDDMRMVVASPAGTGRVLQSSPIAIAGKTGTAELPNKPSHAWFIGYAPYGGGGRKLAFAVLVENGRYGGKTAAPIAGEILLAARELGLL